jgi:hypothetical protein
MADGWSTAPPAGGLDRGGRLTANDAARESTATSVARELGHERDAEERDRRRHAADAKEDDPAESDEDEVPADRLEGRDDRLRFRPHDRRAPDHRGDAEGEYHSPGGDDERVDDVAAIAARPERPGVPAKRRDHEPVRGDEDDTRQAGPDATDTGGDHEAGFAAGTRASCGEDEPRGSGAAGRRG